MSVERTDLKPVNFLTTRETPRYADMFASGLQNVGEISDGSRPQIIEISGSAPRLIDQN
jgi:hypothetical protein